MTETVPKILIVDDEQENVEYVQRALRGKYETITATSGAEGLDLVRKHAFALIISDHRMPEMTGVEFLGEALKMAPETARIILTGFADLDATIDAINVSRVCNFLRKPISPAELVSTIKSAMELYELRQRNQTLIRNLEEKSERLAEQDRMLRLNLDELSSELLDKNQKLEDMVIRDGLTGLYNHRYFQERAEQEVSRARRHEQKLTLVFCDLDYFKKFNDANGHPKGDDALVAVSELLCGGKRQADVVARVRDTDVIARYGGEEFVMLLPQTPKNGGLVLAERLREAVEERAFDGEANLPTGSLTMSLGVATFPDDANDRATLIERADQALYQAKASGRNCVAGYQA